MLQSLSFKLILLALIFVPFLSFAQEVHKDFTERASATVLGIDDEYQSEIIGTDTQKTIQEVRIELTSGEREGDIVELEVEVVSLEVGDKIFVNRVIDISGVEYITYADFERRPVLLVVTILFVGILLWFSRWQGVRALFSLAFSIAAIFFILVPALLAGYNAALTTVGVSAIVMAVVLFGTHGFTPRSFIAFGGTFGTVAITGIIAFFSVEVMKLTGFSNDAAVYLNFATNGQLDLAGLLLGSIIIGILGVLDDVSITQASVVQQLKAANPNLNMLGLYSRAIQVGRDHIGSLVNTLALAYVGVSLPLILLYAKTDSSWFVSLNQEVVAVELLRIIVGSIGLVLAVPATTFVAAWYFNKRNVKSKDCVDHHHHDHSH